MTELEFKILAGFGGIVIFTVISIFTYSVLELTVKSEAIAALKSNVELKLSTSDLKDILK